MAGEFDWTIENNKVFQEALERLEKHTSDLRIPLTLIANDFYRSQRKLFTLKSAGLYPPLGGFNYNDKVRYGGGTLTKRQVAEIRKEERTGHFWAPILFGKTGDLRDSTLSRSHEFSIFNLNKQSLAIGTSIPYAKYHQSSKGRTVMPYRKFVFIDGGPADISKDSAISGRRQRWLNIIDDHIKQLVTGRVL